MKLVKFYSHHYADQATATGTRIVIMKYVTSLGNLPIVDRLRRPVYDDTTLAIIALSFIDDGKWGNITEQHRLSRISAMLTPTRSAGIWPGHYSQHISFDGQQGSDRHLLPRHSTTRRLLPVQQQAVSCLRIGTSSTIKLSAVHTKIGSIESMAI